MAFLHRASECPINCEPKISNLTQQIPSSSLYYCLFPKKGPVFLASKWPVWISLLSQAIKPTLRLKICISTALDRKFFAASCVFGIPEISRETTNSWESPCSSSMKRTRSYMDSFRWPLRINFAHSYVKASFTGLPHLMLDAPEVTVYFSLWDDVAATFWSHLSTENQLNSEMIVTTVNPKLFGGNLFLNSTPATRFFFDPTIDAIMKFKESMGRNGEAAFSRADTTQMVNKVETVTISELDTYISKPAEQVHDAEFNCKARVDRVLKRSGWSYVACGGCSRKLDKSGTALRCNKCVSSRITGIVRYRVELSVEDKIGAATFVVFDTEMTKFLSKTAATLTVEARDEEDIDLPQCLKTFTGKTYLFKIKVTPFNFTPKHRTFTVTTMTEEDPDEEEIEPDVVAIEAHQPQPQIIARENLEDASVRTVTASLKSGEGSGGHEENVSTSRKRERE